MTTIPAPTAAQPAQPYTLSPAPTDLSTISQIDASLTFPSFDASTAWALGSLIRHNLLSLPATSPSSQNPTCVSISLANKTPLFYCATRPGTTPDNSYWVARKAATVLRFGCSTWFMSNKFQQDERAFAAKYGLGEGTPSEYAIHGGGWPVRVKGVEGVVAVVVVSGLKQDQDHQIIVQSVRDFLGAEADAALLEGEKRKED